MRVFLSHSSKDKTGFVRLIADKLNTNNLIIDEKSFTPARLNADEMVRLIDSCDIFVFFISENSLPIEGNIEFEINKAYDYISKNSKIFMPMIISEDIAYKDERIPQWFRDYNLRKILKPTKAYQIIREKINELTWEKKEFLRKKENIFVGRNDFIEKFEDMYYDTSDGSAIFYFISGFESIGRSSLARHCLKKVNKIRQTYVFPRIDLDQADSIEDLIFKLNDLGVSTEINIAGLMNITLKEKIDICINIFSGYFNDDDVILINDRGAIVKPNGQINDWFLDIINGINNIKIGIRAIICTKYKSNYISRKNWSVSIPEMPPKEVRRLLVEYLNLLDVILSNDEITTACNWLQGYPHQVYYLAQYIKNNTYATAHKNSNTIVNYSMSRAESIISEYVHLNYALQFMSTISKVEIANVNTLLDAFGGEEKYKDLLNDLLLKNICTYEGVSGEYVRISEIIANYIQRKGIKHSLFAFNNLKAIIGNEIKNNTEFTPDMPSIYLSVKEKVISDGILEDKYIFPSHLAKSMKEIYNNRNDDAQVINIAQFLISKRTTISSDMVSIARYYLCLALARKKDQKLLEESSMLIDVDKHFVRGFYYRKLGKYIDAINELSKCISMHSNHPRAKAELATCYVRIGDLDSAFNFAKDCYESDRYNIYFIQAYFECLLHKYSREALNRYREEMTSLIDHQYIRENKKDSSMMATMKARFALYIENDIQKSFEVLAEHLKHFSEDLFILNTKFMIYEKSRDVTNMKNTHEDLKNMIKDKDQYSDVIHSNKIRIAAIEFGLDEAVRQIENLPHTFSDDFKIRLRDKISRGFV